MTPLCCYYGILFSLSLFFFFVDTFLIPSIDLLFLFFYALTLLSELACLEALDNTLQVTTIDVVFFCFMADASRIPSLVVSFLSFCLGISVLGGYIS